MPKPILIIDPGHGGHDQGGGSNNLFLEKDMVLKISLYQFSRFTELNVPVEITRNEDIYLSSSERTKIIRESGAKYCISNHINAAPSNTRGVETIHSIYSDGKLAKAIYLAIVEQGIPSRRVFSRESEKIKGKDYYYIHRETGSVISTIIEYGFATNKEDAKLIYKDWRKYAEAVVKAFCNYINFPYHAPKKPLNPNNNPLPTIEKRALVKIEGTTLPAYITNEGKTVIEIRELAEVLNLEIKWEESTKTVFLQRGL